VLALGSVAISFGVVTLARPIVHVIAGPDFGDAVEPARILAFALPSIFCALFFSQLCIAVNQQRALIWVGVGSLVANVTLNLILIPRYTYNGAAVAAVVSQALAFAGAFWLAHRSVKFHFEVGFVLRAALAIAVAALLAVLLLGRSEFAAFVACELALVGTAYAAGAVRGADVRLVLGRGRAGDG
jgi:O-antigen/teichoic acid export membrane protein